MKKIYIVSYLLETFDYAERGEIACFDREELAEQMVARLYEVRPTYADPCNPDISYDYHYSYRAIDCGERLDDFAEVFDPDYEY